ncbi:unnamed protein product [Phytophthora lilii]|uniref:Unnamed protein product n=1 Tax=Phytophthora lilii TaxID=2077276 RepID=A0A9W6TY80_9STRA|nr:unnamed protein product [Phytophthora lilii]
MDVRLDNIFESSEIASPLPKNGSFLILLRQPNMDVGHWTAVHNGEYFDSMGEAAPTKYGIGRYNSKQYQGTYGNYCGPSFSSDVPSRKLTKAFKTGKLSLTANELKGSGSIIHLHPASYEKALKARKAGRGVRLDITRHEVKKGYRRAQGGSIWSKVWGGIKSAFKFAKDSGLLSRAVDAAQPAISTALGAPQAAIPTRAAIRSMTGVGIYDSDSDVEKDGGRITVADVKKGLSEL